MGQTELYLAASFRQLWEGRLEPWFRQVAGNSWRQRLPTAVLVPTWSYAFFLKSKLLASGIGCAGISFWTPSGCREYLFSRFPDLPEVVLRENLSFLLAAGAERIPDNPVAQAVAADPDSLLRCLDALWSAGWDGRSCDSDAIREVSEGLERQLASAGLLTFQDAERWILDKIHSRRNQQGDDAALIESLLVVGLDGSHWPRRQLIQAALEASKNSCIAFVESLTQTTDIDRAWVQHWEARFGKVALVSGTATPPEESRNEKRNAPKSRTTFLIGKNLGEEAAAIVAQAIRFLGQSDCARLGILFAGYGPLCRETARRLAEGGIPFSDALGHRKPPPPSDTGWKAWLNLQRQWRMGELLRFAVSNEVIELFLSLESDEVRQVLDHAFGEVLVDDLDVLASYLQDSENPLHQKLAEQLANLVHLPEKATLQEFLDCTKAALQQMQDERRFPYIAERAAALLKNSTQPISRDLFLRWLDKITEFRRMEQATSGDHPYAKVHLLRYEEASGQEWSHLILAGLNEEGWPPRFEASGFLSERAIDELNRQARQQNASRAQPGATGEPKGILPGPRERRLITESRFQELLDTARSGIGATASLTDETNPGDRLPPSRFLVNLYHAERKQVLTDKRMVALQEQTSAGLSQSSLPCPGEPPEKAEVEQTAIAYQARRVEGISFGEYEFCLSKTPPAPLYVSCKRWESALRKPAETWMEAVLGVKASPSGPPDDRWSLVTGSWVHRWLNRAAVPKDSKSFFPFPKEANFLDALDKAAETTRQRVESAYAKAGRSLPVWWQSGWGRARIIARQLAGRLLALKDWPFMSSEHSVPRDFRVPLPNGRELQIRGRLDLLLLEKKIEQWRSDGTLFIRDPSEIETLLQGQSAWIIDFKTGRADTIDPGKFASGTGLQLGLYALALSRMGAGEVFLSIAGPEEAPKKKAVLAELEDLAPVWEELCRMQDSGVFGVHGELRPEFGQAAEYPLATLEVNPEILKEKWELTHPALKEAAK